LAENTHALLMSRGIGRAIVVGHSMGGMLAARYALMYPDAVDELVLVDPLGLEDWKAEGVPYESVDRRRGARDSTFTGVGGVCNLRLTYMEPHITLE
jgi:pimeloyl-ACP methyl ester carboxylesterase